MNYTLDIIDTADSSHSISLEFAERASIVLNWNGGDEKDAQNIIGSSLAFTMEVNIADSQDSYFRPLFTGDETRYKVRLYATVSDETVWTGFLLPDSYQEPYTNDTFYPKFVATDGLGRLKGKYLADEYYTSEKSVIEFYSAILALTGLQLPINLAPAIENSLEKNYANIYMDGAEFIQKNKKMDAYAILNELLVSMLCTVFQAEDAWYIEGFNQRHLRTVSYWNYDHTGAWLDYTKKIRLIKDFKNALATPNITILPPYKSVNITSERRPQALPDTIAQEKNDGWAVGQGVPADTYPTDWVGNGGYYAKGLASDYKVVLPTYPATTFNDTKFISLQKKIYVRKNDKLVFKGVFKTPVSARTGPGAISPNGIKLTFKLNGVVFNSVERTFDISDEITISFDIYINTPGLLDLEITEPFFDGGVNQAAYITIQSLELDTIGFKDTDIFQDTISDDFSTLKEVDLPITDDASAYSKAFRLAKLNAVNPAAYNEINVPVQYGFTQNGNYYSVVAVDGANLIADNPASVTHTGSPINILGVFYNFQGGDQMAVQVESAITSGNFVVRKYKIADYTADRAHWEQWTDALYPVYRDRYGKAAASVYRRLFTEAHERVEFTLDDAVKFNDLLYFNYVLASNYFLTNVSWNVDRGETSATMIKCVYENLVIGGGDQLPIVDAGPDIVIGQYVFETPIVAVASDPDGFIQSVLWENITPSGAGYFTDPTSLSTQVNGLLEYVTNLKVTVTDNDGNTASDTVNVYREQGYAISLTKTLDFRGAYSAQRIRRYEFVVTPELATDYAITVNGSYSMNTLVYNGGFLYSNTVVKLTITKNGASIFSKIESSTDYTVYSGDFLFNYIPGDTIVFELEYVLTIDGTYDFASMLDNKVLVEFELTNTVFQQGAGVISGLPIKGHLAEYP